VIFAAENSNKFQKTRFWKEKLVEDMVTLGPTNMHLGQPLGTWWEYEGTIQNTFGNTEIQKRIILNFFNVQG
jgi:hypothetical protein